MKPLALLCYSSLLPGSQLAGHLQDLGYRVQTIPDSAALLEKCAQEKPLVALVEVSQSADAFAGIARMKQNAATSHVPVLAFSAAQDQALQTAAAQAGVSMLAGHAAMLEHLPQLLDQVLQVE